MNRCCDEDPLKSPVCVRSGSSEASFGSSSVVSSPMRNNSIVSPVSSYNSVNSTPSPNPYPWIQQSMASDHGQNSCISSMGSAETFDRACDTQFNNAKRRDGRQCPQSSTTYTMVSPKMINSQGVHSTMMPEPPNKKVAIFPDNSGVHNSGSNQNHISRGGGGVHHMEEGNGNRHSLTNMESVSSTSKHNLGQRDHILEAHVNYTRQADSQNGEFTQCIINQKPAPNDNELKRLLTTAAGNGNQRSTPSYDTNNNGNNNGSNNGNNNGNNSYMRHDNEYSTENGSLMVMHMNGREGMPKQSGYWMNPNVDQGTINEADQVQIQRAEPPEPMIEDEDESMNVVKFNLWNGDSANLPIYPSGLEVLWREVPEDCQSMITPQDVPEAARFRGYFTVCELITLKKNLLTRQTERRHGAGNSGGSCSNGPKSATATAAALAASQAAEISNAAMNMGVGSAFKEAMNTLNPEEMQEQGHQSIQMGQHPQITGSRPSPPTMQNMESVHSTNMTMDIVSSQQHQAAMNAFSARSSNDRFKDKAEMLKGLAVPPPPYRTSTLVFKLLEIGSYHFRSFSDCNPNRLRVLFNTQRLSYECQLPIVPPGLDSSQHLRKILTIEVNFDQISVMKFGSDKMFLRVDGPPILNVTYSPSNEESYPKNLSPEDQYLLDQIDRGQLKLSPNHHLYFINERLVHVLENQFREHPRFRHLLSSSEADSNCGR